MSAPVQRFLRDMAEPRVLTDEAKALDRAANFLAMQDADHSAAIMALRERAHTLRQLVAEFESGTWNVGGING